MSRSAPERTSLLASMAPGLLSVGMLGALAMSGVAGCDTVARLSFSDRSFEDLEVVGVTPAAGSCQGSDGAAVMRFLMFDGSSLPITNASVLENNDVSLTRDDVSVASPTYFDTPSVKCADRESDCTSGFACDDAPSGDGQLCQLASGGVSLSGNPSFVSATDKNQVFGVLVENSASMIGALPSSIENLSPDYTGGEDGGPDGIADAVGNDYRRQLNERAADPSNSRSTSVSQMASVWEAVAEQARGDFQTITSFGLWTFSGSAAELVSHVPTATGSNPTFWVNSPSQVNTAVQSLQGASTTKQLAAVYESIDAVLSDAEGFARFDADTEKALVVIVDGPDDLRLSGITADSIIEEATSQGVRIFFVHLDPAVEVSRPSGLPLIPDVPEYVQFQDAPCASDDDCKNFEECRQVTAYAANAGGDVKQPADKIEGTYCAIARDENGRVGPIDDYARIACETGGSYLYFADTQFLDAKVDFLPAVLDGLWEAPLTFDAYNRGALEAGEPYLIDTSVEVTAGENSRSIGLSEGATLGDRRLVLFSSPE